MSSPLRFEIDFPAHPATGTAAERTSGHLCATLGETKVWDAEWTWIELLEHLAANWKYLRWEEDAPIEVDVDSPSDIEAQAAQRFREGSEPAEAEDLFFTFCQSHDLARALQGAWLPRLWVLRRGLEFHVWSEFAQTRLPESALIGELERLGETVLERLSGASDPRSREAEQAWRTRNSGSAAQLVSIATGLSSDVVIEAAGGEDHVSEFWEVEDDPAGELLAAARMVGSPASPRAIRAIGEAIRAIGPVATPALDELAAKASETLTDVEPYLQGYELARWLRVQLGRETQPINPKRGLVRWGVQIENMETDPNLDAICCWGKRHGPAVIVNTKGRHAQGSGGRRATLAHEIAHLLVDRGRALPFAEVLGGRAPRAAEQRARAFAAEFLLPREVAKAAVEQGGVESALQECLSKYRVSNPLAAWQILNSGTSLSADDRWLLRGLVPPRHRW